MKIPLERWRAPLFNVLRWATPFLALVLIGLVYFLGIRTERTGFVREVLDPGLKRFTEPVLNAFRGGVPPVPQFKILLDSTAMDSLEVIETRARSDGWLLAEQNARFIGQVQLNDSSWNAAIALKDGSRAGTEPTHPWSLEIRLAVNDTLLGMQHFDLVPVVDGAPLHAWLMSRVLADQDLPFLSREFVEVGVARKRATLRFMEGRIDSASIAQWGTAQGPLVWFGDELLVGSRSLGSPPPFASVPPMQADWMAAPVMNSMSTAAVRKADLKGQQQAIQALEAFRTGRSSASQVFDIQRLARLFALCDLLGEQGTIAWWNLRFLPDSTSEKLVAVPWQYMQTGPIGTIQALTSNTTIRFPSKGNSFNERLFSDPLFYKTYIAYLDTMSMVGWTEDLLARAAPTLELQERIVAGHFPHARLDRSIFQHDRDVIHRTLHPKDLALAYVEDRQGPLDRLAVANVHALPVEITAFIAGTDTVDLPNADPLWPREHDKPLNYSILPVKVPAGMPPPSKLIVRLYGLALEQTTPIRTWNTFPAN